VASETKSDYYEQFEPVLNGGVVRLPDIPTLESQLLSLVWRGGKIDHLPGEHDDFANACAGAVALVGAKPSLQVYAVDLNRSPRVNAPSPTTDDAKNDGETTDDSGLVFAGGTAEPASRPLSPRIERFLRGE